MASPVDAALIASQTYKLRPTTPQSGRVRTSSENEPAVAGQGQGRRSAPAVTLSLSSEALDILNGNGQRPAQPQRDPYNAGQSATADSGINESDVNETGASEPDATGTTFNDAVVRETEDSGLFEPLQANSSHRREAPFAHLRDETANRYVAPGSRLDISV